jgi:membrane protein
VQEVSPKSPEERRRHPIGRALDELAPGTRVYEVVKRVTIGVWKDGFIHAGNLAYLTLLTLFPFFIVTAALASLFGRTPDTLRAVGGFLKTLPPSVQAVLAQPISDVLTVRTGTLLWLGALVGLWTVGSFIETIRDILRRAYGTPFSGPFWQYRLSSMGIIVLSVILVMVAFSAQVFLAAAEQFVTRLLPFAGNAAGWIGISKLVPLLVIWFSMYLLIWSLTPSRYRYGGFPKWPGALLIALWWYGALALLPAAIAQFGGYDLTYGSLAGVIVALIFFWFIGLGIVIGAHLNAALAEPAPKRVEDEDTAVKDAT